MKKRNNKDTKEQKKRPECKKCHSKLVYLRIKTNELVCRTCGYVEKLNNSVDKN